MPRTRAFAGIMMHRMLNINHISEGTVPINGPKEDSRIRFAHFDAEALKEVMPIYEKKGEYYCYSNWFNHTNEFAGELKKQPVLANVIKDVVGFAKDFEKKANQGDKIYKMTIGISHTWVVDSVIQTFMPSFHEHSQRVMDTSSFFKVEAGQFNFLGKWVDFDKR